MTSPVRGGTDARLNFSGEPGGGSLTLVGSATVWFEFPPRLAPLVLTDTLAVVGPWIRGATVLHDPGGAGAPAGRCARGRARRLYLKQMVAHFGHHPAIQWTLCEENYTEPGQFNGLGNPVPIDFTIPQLEAMATWIERWDSLHDHPVSVHAHGWDNFLYDRIVGTSTHAWLDVTSEYIYAGEPNADLINSPAGPDLGPASDPHLYDKETEDLRTRLAAVPGTSGKRVAISIDEPGEWKYGLSGTNDNATNFGSAFYAATLMSSPEGRRQLALYDVLLSGGSIDHYAGYGMALDGFQTVAGAPYVTCNPHIPGVHWTGQGQ